jgi:hypothetical protein
MAMMLACPSCGTPMREIVWGFGTLADMEEQGDVVVGGCVVDVDEVGRVAFAECPSCGTRADQHGIALERPEPAPAGEHPFAVSFSSPPSDKWEVSMSDATRPPGAAEQGEGGFAADDFGAARSAPDTWRDQVDPYSSHDDEVPQPSAPAPDRVEPYASREDALPERGGAAPERVEPYASHDDDVPAGSAPSPERVAPYSSHDEAVPDRSGQWRERVEPFAAGDGAGEAGAGSADAVDRADEAPGERVPERLDPYATRTSRFTDAEEEGWPPPRDGSDDRDDDGPYPVVG